jgi:hypothetical protein
MAASETPGAQVPSEEDRATFRRSLASLTPEHIRDKVLAGEYGPYNPADPRLSHWKAREANRLITARQRAKELRPQWIGIVISTLLGLAALIVAILAYLKQK